MPTKRGRKSTAELATAPASIDKARQRPPPPDGLGEAEASIWRRVVSSLPPDWIRPEQRELLANYCRHQHRAERFSRIATKLAHGDGLTRDDIEDVDKACKLCERESRAALALARALRLTVTSQTRAETAASKRAASSSGRPPWEAETG